jgi:hypothetical protein
MSFTPGIPQVGQSLGSSRSLVLNNFASLRSTIAVNHGDVNGPNTGKHLQVEMPRQNPTAPTNIANEGTLYAFLSPDAGVNTDVFYKVDASVNAYQLTRIIDSAPNFALFGTNPGWTFLPGALLLQWGFHNGNLLNATGTEPFSIPFTDRTSILIFTQPYSTNASIPGSQATISVTNNGINPAVTGFAWEGITNSVSWSGFWWAAIGH